MASVMDSVDVMVVKCECGARLPVKTVRQAHYNKTTLVQVGRHECRKPAPPIDELVEENKEELEALHMKFLKWDDMKKHWMCDCPMCRSLEKGGDCQK